MITEELFRYADQPSRLPERVRGEIESVWGGSPILLYGLADLTPSMRLARNWVALGEKHIAVADGNEIRLIELDQVGEVKQVPGMSSTTLKLLDRETGTLLAELRYSNRQRKAMANLAFLLEDEANRLRRSRSLKKSADEAYEEAVLHGIREAQASVSGNRLAVVRRLLGYLKPYRAQAIIGMAGAVLMTAVSLVPAFLSGHLIDEVIRPFENGTMTLDQAGKTAWLVLGTLAVVYVLRETFAWVRLRTMSVIGEYVARDLRDELYRHLQKLGLDYFSRKQTGSIISRVTSDTDRIWDFIAFGVVEVAISLVMLTGLSAVLIWLDWKLGLVMTLPVPLLLLTIFRHGSKMQELFLRAWRKWSNLTDVVSDTVPGVKVVKAFNREESEVKRFSRRNAETITEFKRIHHAWTGFWPKLMLSIQGLMLLVWALALPRLISDAPTLTAGTFISFLLYLTMFVQPVEVIGQMARMLNRATSSAHRIFEVLDTEPKIVTVENPVRLEPVRGEVVFEKVTFSYDGIRPVLKEVSCRIRPGEMIGLVGPSGGGKSTFTNLIARFFDATDGRVLIDEVDVKRLDCGHYRKQIGMVLQDPYLFHGTILENIRYGRPEAEFGEVIEAARAANAHEFILKLPHGYDTVVGERGHTLSGGERQRVSIARAVLCDPKILILDEATSAVDTETERKIQDALDRLVKGRTVFAIAHRLSTLKKADRLLVIENGRIAEEGTHAELLSKEQGVYRKLHRMQQELHDEFVL